MTEASDELARGEWAVLALLAERPSHGWLLSRQLAPDGEIGQIWSGDRQRVYRAIRRLADQGLIEAVLTEPGQGAHRTVFRPTAEGTRRLERWLSEPVDHIREIQNTFALKLVFSQRLGRETQGLLTAQRNIVVAAAESLAAKVREGSAYDQVHLRLRLETTRALITFIDGLSNHTAAESSQPPRVHERPGAEASILRSGRGDRTGKRDASGGGRRPAAAPGARVSDFSGRALDDDLDTATIIVRFGRGGEIVVASAHVEDPVVAEIAAVAHQTSPQSAAGPA